MYEKFFLRASDTNIAHDMTNLLTRKTSEVPVKSRVPTCTKLSIIYRVLCTTCEVKRMNLSAKKSHPTPITRALFMAGVLKNTILKNGQMP